MKGFGTILDEISGNKSIESSHVEVRHIDVKAINVNQSQPRKIFNLDEIESLSRSILENGLINPITVRAAGNGYELIAGERRWRAVCHLGWDKISAIIKNIDDSLVRIIALVENLQREDLTPIEIANAYFELSRLNGMTHDEVAKCVGKPRSSISNYLRLLSLSPDVQKLIGPGMLDMGHAKLLIALPYETQISVSLEVLDKKLSVRQLEALIKRTLFSPAAELQESSVSTDDKCYAAEDFLSKKLCNRFNVSYSKNGKNNLFFASPQELEKFMKLICDKT